MNCPVCYDELFSSEELTPRTLPCEHVCCTRCLLDMFDADGLTCPECFQFVECGAVEELPVSLQEEVLPEAPEEEPASPTPSDASGTSDQKTCLVVGCENKRTHSGYCTFHGTRKRLSRSFASQVADKVQNAPLAAVVLEADRIRVKNVEGWPDIDPYELIERFRQQKRMDFSEAQNLIERSRDVFRKEPNIVQLKTPIIAVGDIHGQFFDLLNLLEVGGRPGTETCYLFLGDYVDRGKFSCEVIFTLLALKVTYPDKIWLIRGNHECRSTTTHFGFKEECKMKYGSIIYSKLLLCFETMPICALVETGYGNIFACHGGISPSLQTLEEIEQIDRFVEPDMQGALCDILWADPVDESDVHNMTDMEYQEFLEIDWRPNPMRGCSYCFGYKAIKEFLNNNNLLCMIRAHEVQELGFARHFDPAALEARVRNAHKQSRHSLVSDISQDDVSACYSTDTEVDSVEFPPVITIFSAPNYCDRYGNKAAILRIDTEVDGFRVLQYDCVPHPDPDDEESQDNKHLLAMIKTCPYMPTTFRDFVRLAVELGPADGIFDDYEYASDEESIDGTTTAETSAHPDEAHGPSPAKTESSDMHAIDDVADELVLEEEEENQPISPGDHREISFTHKSRNSISHSVLVDSSEPMRGMSPRRSDADMLLSAAMGSSAPLSQSPMWRALGVDVDDSYVPKPISQRWPREPSGWNRNRANTYRLAAARDGINEMHPDILEKRIQQLDQTSLFPEELESPASISHAVPESERPSMSVADIRRRFERKGSVSQMLQQHPETPDIAEMQAVFHAGGYVSVSNLRRLFETTKRNSREQLSGSSSSHGHASQEQLHTIDENDHGCKSAADGTTKAAPPPQSQSPPQPREQQKAEHANDGAVDSTVETADASADLESDNLGNGDSAADDTEEERPRRPRNTGMAGHVAFTRDEIIGLKLMFTLLDLSGDGYIELEEFIAFAEESGDYSQIREAKRALEIVDVDKDGRMGLLDYIHFAARLKELQEANRHATLMQELRRRNSTSSEISA